jgi:hypothetical protein
MQKGGKFDNNPQLPALQQANQYRQNPWQQKQRGQDPGSQGQRQQTAQARQQATRPAA